MAVDTSTGALSLNLIHLSTISFRLAVTKKRKRRSIFEVKGSQSCFYLAAECPLDEIACFPGDDHLFMLMSSDSAETYLILRKSDGSQSSSYKLIAASGHLFIASSRCAQIIVHSLYSEIEKAQAWFSKKYRLWYRLHGFFPGMQTFSDFAPAFQAFFAEQNGLSTDFESTYLSCINPGFRPRISASFLEFSLPPRAFFNEYNLWDTYAGEEHTYYGASIQMFQWHELVYSGGANPSQLPLFQNPWE